MALGRRVRAFVVRRPRPGAHRRVAVEHALRRDERPVHDRSARRDLRRRLTRAIKKARHGLANESRHKENPAHDTGRGTPRYTTFFSTIGRFSSTRAQPSDDRSSVS
ncbi:hypothetical protein BCEP4_220148 [Burkholderia cepacia]|nr:hypothetical protein BCEP4_220148 [Burkholderia cepacia]